MITTQHADSSFYSSSSSLSSHFSSFLSSSSSSSNTSPQSLFLRRMAANGMEPKAGSNVITSTTKNDSFSTTYSSPNVTSGSVYTNGNSQSELLHFLFQFLHNNSNNNNNTISTSRNDSFSTNHNYFVSNASVDNLTHVLKGAGGGATHPKTQKWGMLALTIIILCTTVGNLLVCLAVCWERRLQNMTNYFLMSLAIADFLVSLLVMPLGMVVAIYGYFPLNAELCVLWSTSDVLMCTASIWHMCTMSMDRFFTLKYPMRYGRNKTRRMVIGKILFVWIISIAISCPIGIMGLVDRTAVFNEGVCVPTVTSFIFYGSIFAFYIPLMIMLVTYVLTIKILWKNQQRMKSMERSELKPKLAQLTAQCTGFAVPKLLTNIRKQQKHKKENNLKLVRSCPSPIDPVSCSTDDRTALSSNYDPYEGDGHNHQDFKMSKVNSSDTRGMTYLPLPNPHTYHTTSSRSASPASNSSCNEYLSSETEDSELETKYVSLLKSSPSFRSLCSPANKTISETPLPPAKRRARKLSYKERQRRQQQYQQKQQQQQQQQLSNNQGHNNNKLPSNENYLQITPLISIDGSSADSILDQDLKSSASESNHLEQPRFDRKNRNGSDTHKGVSALVSTLSLLSSPLNFHWSSQRQLSCPNSPSKLFRFSPSKFSLSLSKLSPKNSPRSSTSALSTSVSHGAPPELKIQQPSTDSSVVSQMNVSKHSNISNNSSLSQSDLRFEPLPNFMTSQNTSARETPSQLEVPCPGYYRKLPVTRTSSGPILGGAVSDSHVCQTGLGAKTGDPGRRGLGSFPLSCGNLSKDYKSEEWDRRYFQIQEEMDELLRESFDRKATCQQDNGPHSDNISTSPESPLTTPKSADYMTTSAGTKQMCFFRSHSMPNSPEKFKRRRRKKIMETKDSSSTDDDNNDDDEEDDYESNGFDDTSDNELDEQLQQLFKDSETGGENIRGEDKSAINHNTHHEETPEREINESKTKMPADDTQYQTVYSFPKINKNDVITICLHPPASDVSEFDTSDGSEFHQSNQNHSPSHSPLLTPENKLKMSGSKTSNCDDNSSTKSQNSSRLSVNTLNRDTDSHRRSSLGNESVPLHQASNTTSSSQLEGNIPSEADLTLDETDDTLEGEPSQECYPSEELTENTQEDVETHLASESGQNSWFGFKKRPQNLSKKKRKYSKKTSSSSSSRNKNLANSFRMRKLKNNTVSGEEGHVGNSYIDISTRHTHDIHLQNSHTNDSKTPMIPAKHILSKKTASNEQKASKVLGIIFLVFVLLWSPFFIVNIVSSICPTCLMSVTEDMMSLIVWMGYVASLANPIIYTMFNTAFRKTFVDILTCRLAPSHCILTSSRGRHDVRMRKRRSRLGGRPVPSYSTVVASDRRNTVTLVLRDESR